jgi:hypothetical protein
MHLKTILGRNASNSALPKGYLKTRIY